MKEVHYLKNLQNLKILMLSENPITDLDKYRLKIIKILPKLEKLDHDAVTENEKEQAFKI